MEHLVGLCHVLGMSLDEAAGKASSEAATDEEHVWLDALRAVGDGVDREYLLATAVQMGKRPK